MWRPAEMCKELVAQTKTLEKTSEIAEDVAIALCMRKREY